MKIIGYFLMVALLIWLVATYAGNAIGITLSGENTYISALIFGVVLALVNLIVGGILRIITLPLNFLTFGFISFLITIFMIYLTDSMHNSISIDGFIAYIIVALIPTVANVLLGRKK